ncbi:glucosyltransferase domain-containing protein, partial [Escherichia coli]|uniref:glucosyltransferase domain-containing protein n=1 Tax=Escherichia coli TaxID=562 RepID=UPI00227E91B0
GYGWHHDGRFISTYLARILSFNMHGITSLFPFSIFLSATIMVIAGFIIIHALDILTSSIRSYLPALFLLTSPFYLENLAYRFDSIYMSLSVFFSVLPFLFLGKNKFIVVSIFSFFLVFGLYQTS